MTSNVGKLDRLIRMVVGLALMALPLQNIFGLGANNLYAYTLMGVGGVLTLTAIFGFCPMYRLLRIKT